MRKIISKHQKQKQERRNQFIVGGVLILVMLASVLGYAFQGENNDASNKIKYKDLEFQKQDNYWYLEDLFRFSYNPLETENFEFAENINSFENYQNEPLYIYSENKYAEAEIYFNLYNYAQRIQYACLDGEEMQCETSWPMKNCSNNFIIIREGEFEIKQKENCLFISGEKEDLTKISDEVLFKILKIKQ
jgi:hypothetical protein